jgi:hypothetical protein
MTAQQRRDYMRGYRLGRRNASYTELGNNRLATTRGWGAGQGAWTDTLISRADGSAHPDSRRDGATSRNAARDI